MNLRFIDWIWHVRGNLALGPGQSGTDAFDKLDPLFRQTGTTHQRTNDTLIFSKKDQSAQDKMSIFDGGVLRIDKGVAGPVLRYHLISRALLFCFLAPLLFIGIAQATIVINKSERPSVETEKKQVAPPMNPIDKALGAPAPGTSKRDLEDAAKEKNEKPSPISAYVLAAMFGALYVGGRIFEDRLVKDLFRKRLLEA